MDIEFVREQKKVMELAILEAAERAVAEFHRQTGLSPTSVYLELIDTTPIGETASRYSPVRVDAYVTL